MNQSQKIVETLKILQGLQGTLQDQGLHYPLLDLLDAAVVLLKSALPSDEEKAEYIAKHAAIPAGQMERKKAMDIPRAEDADCGYRL